jgi:lipopolysaccharide export LptBFGC system permease protein LptF
MMISDLLIKTSEAGTKKESQKREKYETKLKVIYPFLSGFFSLVVFFLAIFIRKK